MLAACSKPALDELDTIYYDGDARHTHCAANLDEKANLETADILGAVDRAADRGEILELYAHVPGRTVSVERLETVIAYAQNHGLTFFTYADLARRVRGPGLALSFDDRAVADWSTLRPLFAAHGVHATFFVTGYAYFDDTTRASLRTLADDGHDIAAHGVDHLRAPPYVEQHGLRAYLNDEALPSIQILRDEGYTVTSYAYPFGAHTSELDDAILEHVSVVRSIDFPYSTSIQSPCR